MDLPSHISHNLKVRIEYSIDLLRKSEKLALAYKSYGFHLAFSGGKDSQVLYHLAKMAGVKFEAHMQLTSVDPPELMRFIRTNYSDVFLHAPKENIYQLIVRKKSLPTRKIRFCCQVLKEHAGVGAVTLLGIRAQESVRRAKRSEIEKGYNSLAMDEFDINQEQLISCVNGNDKVIVSPIFKWSNRNVWEFLHAFNISYCKLYDEGYTRIGCMFCPMASTKNKQHDLKRYPKVALAYKKAIRELVCRYGTYDKLNYDVDKIFNWWISNKPIDDYLRDNLHEQLKIFEYEC